MRFLARLCVFLALLWGGVAQAQVAFVQNAVSDPGGTPTSVTATFGAGVGSGHFVIGVITAGVGTTFSLTTVTDGHGNNPTAFIDNIFDSGGPFATASFYYQNVTNGATAFTFTPGGTPGTTAIQIIEFSGVLTSGNPIDQHNQAAIASTGAPNTFTYTTNSITTLSNGDGIYAYRGGTETGFDTVTAAGGTGATFTLRNNGAGATVADSSAIQSSAGSVQGTFTVSSASANTYQVGIVAFKQAAGGGPTCPQTLALMGVGC